MRRIRNTAILGAVTAVALVGLGTGTALADPPPGTVPAPTDIVGVGSDTVTPLFAGSPTENSSTSQALSFDYNNQSPAPTNKLYSWDAVNPTTGATGDQIVTKSGCTSIARPNGSSAGITALINTGTTSGSPCIDFARSSRPPQAGDPTSIDFVAYAQDAIDYSSPAPLAGQTSPVPDNLTWQDLANIYTCTWTDWSQVPGSTGSGPITAVLPQAGSGTRSTFLLELAGGPGNTPINPGSCVVNGKNPDGSVIEENTGVTAGNEEALGTATAPNVNAVFPYSIGDWIAQGPQVTFNGNPIGGHANPSLWAHGDLALHTMADDNGASQVPIETPTTDPTINPNWVFEAQRLLYNVVKNAATPPATAIPSNLQSLFSSTGWLCTNPTAQNDIASYGFESLGSSCGTEFIG